MHTAAAVVCEQYRSSFYSLRLVTALLLVCANAQQEAVQWVVSLLLQLPHRCLDLHAWHFLLLT
jgi:hypothetical protein